MRVLVTGATGFLGLHVVEALGRRGHHVRAVYRSGSAQDLHGAAESVVLDLRRPDGLVEALADVDVVVHAAAVMRGEPDELIAGTVGPTEQLVAAMREAGVSKLVLVSSFAVYVGVPGPEGRLRDESDAIGSPDEARDAYATAKLLQEQLAAAPAADEAWSVTLARPGVVYGPGHLWTNRLGYRVGERLWVCVGGRAQLPLTYVGNAADAIAHLAETTASSDGGARAVNIVDDDAPTQREYREALRARGVRPRWSVELPWPVVYAGVRALDRVHRLLGEPVRMPGALRTESALTRWQPVRVSNHCLRSLGWIQPVAWPATLDAAVGAVGRDAPARLPREGAGSLEAPVASVIVPAFNEESNIERCLRALLDDAWSGEFDVVVVCNACTDDTAAIARTVSDDVRVLETPVPSKTRAMNLGDDEARAFPRVYMDADVELSTAGLRTVIAPLRGGELEASAPMMRFDTRNSPWLVRAYHCVWSTLPQVSSGLGGRGLYAISEAGRRRFGPFPDIIADDLFVDWTFPLERRTVVDASSLVRAEPSLRQLIQRKSRIAAGRTELLERGSRPWATSGAKALLTTIVSRPWLLPKVPVYVLVTLEARRRGRRRLANGSTPSWEPLR